MKYILSYVNDEDDEHSYDQEFETYPDLYAFVTSRHDNFTSFEIIVVRD